MAIPITVDNVTYRSTNELVKRLGFKVSTSILYRRFTSKKHTFTGQEIEEAVKWINENTKSKPKEKVINASSLNLGTLIYDYFTLYTKTLDNSIVNFITGLPIAGLDPSVYKDYVTNNYVYLKDVLPNVITLNNLLEIVDYYTFGILPPNTRIKQVNREHNSKSNPITVKGKRLMFYVKEYGLRYNLVHSTYKETLNENNPEEAFIKQLEEKRNQLIQRRLKKEQKYCSNK